MDIINLARQERFELPTYCLEGSCSILLSYWRIYISRAHVMERVMGIEPTYPAWKAGVLPLNYTRTVVSIQLENNNTGTSQLSTALIKNFSIFSLQTERRRQATALYTFFSFRSR